MPLDTHWNIMYGANVTELAGTQQKSLLKEFVSKDAKGGEAIFFDTMDVGDEAVEIALASIPAQFRAAYEASSKTISDWNALVTPHMEVELGRVMLAPKKIEWGHTFRDLDEVVQNSDPRSMKIKQGMKTIFKKEDKTILDALFAASKQTGKDLGNLATTNFPAAQILNEPDGVFDLETITSINELYDDNFLTDEKKFCLISPATKKMLIDNSGDKITSKDFVDSGSYFANGTLPDIYGICFIVHPMVKDYKGTYDDCFVVFTADSVVLNQFKPLTTKLDEDPTQRFQPVFYVQEMLNAVRIDDKTVVQGTLGTV